MLAKSFVPSSFADVLSEFRSVFTAPTYANFQVLVYGWLHALGRGRVSDAIRAATSFAEKHFSAYYRFFSRAEWALDALGMALLGMVIRVFDLDEVELVLDDTLMRKTGKKIAHAGMHKDPLFRSSGRPFHSYGHVFVVLAVHIRVPDLAKTGWALPFLFRLFQSSSQGGREDAPSDQRRARNRRQQGKEERRRVRKTDREVQDGQLQACAARPDTGPLPKEHRLSKPQLAARMILKVARRFPDLHFVVIADHLYNGKTVLRKVHEAVDNVHFVMRGRHNAALWTLPPERKPGQPGRPRVRGERLPNPADWAEDHPEEFAPRTVTLYGKAVQIETASYRGMHYRSLPGRLMRYVIVRDPEGIYDDEYLFTTDPSESDAAVVERYARRWPIERAFQDAKQKLGAEDSEAQLPRAVRRTAPFSMALYSTVVFWYVTTGYAEAAELPDLRAPWEPEPPRTSFRDMLAALRRLGWARAVADPPSPDTTPEERLLEYLARVVAAA